MNSSNINTRSKYNKINTLKNTTTTTTTATATKKLLPLKNTTSKGAATADRT